MSDSPAPAHAESEFLQRLQAATPRVRVTPALIALNVAAFVALLAAGVPLSGGSAEDYLRFGANFGPLTTGGEWWRTLSCTFVHAGVLHLACNLWALWDGGRLAERLFGHAWFAAIYLFAGVSGSLASLLWRNDAISVGASGAVFGVFGALLAYTLRERGSIPPAVTNRLRASSSVFVAFSLFYGFAAAGIDNAAHLGGLAGGFVMGLIAARPLDAVARARGRARRLALALAVAFAVLPTAASFAPDSSRVYRQALALQQAVDAFVARERALNSGFEAVVAQARDGRLDERSAARELRGPLLAGWDEALAQLAALELDAQAPLRRDYDLLLDYGRRRREMVVALADFMELATPANRQRFLEQRAATEAALAAYRERVGRKR